MAIRRTTWTIAGIGCVACIGVGLAHAADAKPERPLSQVGRYVPHPLAGGGYAAMDTTNGQLWFLSGNRWSKMGAPIAEASASVKDNVNEGLRWLMEQAEKQDPNFKIQPKPDKDAAVRPGASERGWELIGLKLEPLATNQLPSQSRRQGGLLVTAVRPEGPAARQSIRRGDILVGLHTWPTVSAEDVAKVLNRRDLADLQPMKFYILRGGETLYGHLAASLPSQDAPQEK